MGPWPPSSQVSPSDMDHLLAPPTALRAPVLQRSGGGPIIGIHINAWDNRGLQPPKQCPVAVIPYQICHLLPESQVLGLLQSLFPKRIAPNTDHFCKQTHKKEIALAADIVKRSVGSLAPPCTLSPQQVHFQSSVRWSWSEELGPRRGSTTVTLPTM